MKVFNKFSGEAIAELPDTDMNSAREILAASLKASYEMAKLPSFRLQDAVDYIAGELKNRSSELSAIITAETGKPIRYSRAEVEASARAFRSAAHEIYRDGGEAVPMDVHEDGINRVAFYRRFPVGIVYAVAPFWNPLSILSGFAAPALASGNSVIAKPSEFSPLSAAKLAEIVCGSGLPENAMSACFSDGGSASSNLFLQSGDVGVVAFAGKRSNAARISVKTGMKRVIAWSGGNSPAIVWDDADLDAAAVAVAEGAFGAQTQGSLHVQRIIVKSDSYEYFRNRIVEIGSALKAGDPAKEETDIGPLSSSEAAQTLEKMILDAGNSGASRILGGKHDGSLFPPTLMENVPVSSDLWGIEIMGPMSCIMPVDSLEEAISAANNEEGGLQAGIFTSDLNLAMTAIERLNFSSVMVNDISMDIAAPVPYGGVRSSGTSKLGIRYLMDEMTEARLAVIKR